MKIFISADIEGVTGISTWDETSKGRPEYEYFKQQMTKEVSAACLGAISAGCNEILLRDAHDSGANIDTTQLPLNTFYLKGFNGHPFCMMQGLDETFDAAIMIGYHSFASSGDNPLCHTLDPAINYIKINDILASEFLINAYTAAYVNVPIVFVSGDEGLCRHIKSINPNITTLGVNKGIGSSIVSIHPKLAIDTIKYEVEKVLLQDFDKCKIQLPESFKVEVCFKDCNKAYSNSFYPGAKLITPNTILFTSNDYFEVLRMFCFI